MIGEARQHFNAQFLEQKYQDFLRDLNEAYQYTIPFRVAETPVFVPKAFEHHLLKASHQIINFIIQHDFASKMTGAIPAGLVVPAQTPHTLFLALDFAVCRDAEGNLVPRLIELQGFPSLFGYQDFLGRKFQQHYQLPKDLHFHFGMSSEAYWSLLKNVIVGEHDPAEVVLLEIHPLRQNTAIDFFITQQHLGITPVHLGDVKRRGEKLFYTLRGMEREIKRIYNRVIFDELKQHNDMALQFSLTEDVQVEWAGHPNWFFLISKYTMPFLKSEYVPECSFLSDYDTLPGDLENYVLKPLYSFSGSGVIFHVTDNDIAAIDVEKRNQFLLQRKVQYEPVVQAPDGLVKTEIRLLFIWQPGEERPKLITNLARLSRGEMIGVKFNKNKTWVGGTIGFFES